MDLGLISIKHFKTLFTDGDRESKKKKEKERKKKNFL